MPTIFQTGLVILWVLPMSTWAMTNIAELTDPITPGEDDPVRELLTSEELKKQFTRQTDTLPERFELVSYAVQPLRDGMNYFAKMRMGHNYFTHLRVFQPHNGDQPTQLVAFLMNVPDDEPIHYFLSNSIRKPLPGQPTQMPLLNWGFMTTSATKIKVSPVVMAVDQSRPDPESILELDKEFPTDSKATEILEQIRPQYIAQTDTEPIFFQLVSYRFHEGTPTTTYFMKVLVLKGTFCFYFSSQNFNRFTLVTTTGNISESHRNLIWYPLWRQCKGSMASLTHWFILTLMVLMLTI